MTATYSFARDTKDSLCGLPCKRECCRRSLLYGMLLFTHSQYENSDVSALYESLMSENYGISGSYEQVDSDMLICEECTRTFLRGAFLVCGTITNPDRAYHLELQMPNERLSDSMVWLLTDLALPPKKTIRKSNIILYYKESESIEDFLNLMGAQKSAFEVMNAKIVKDLRNNANRAANCDTANIDKSVNAAQLQIEAINKLENAGRIELLSDELKETAVLRLKNEDLSLAELAELHNPQISKSGVNHRLKKIVEFAKNDEKGVKNNA